MRLLALFPARMATLPASFGGGQWPMESVPTAVVRGPGDAYYVGEFTGLPFPVGGANVYRVPRNGGRPRFTALRAFAWLIAKRVPREIPAQGHVLNGNAGIGTCAAVVRSSRRSPGARTWLRRAHSACNRPGSRPSGSSNSESKPSQPEASEPREPEETQIYAGGFTTISDIAFGPDRSLY